MSEKKSINALFIIHGLNVGGMEKHLLMLCSELLKTENNVTVISLTPDGILRPLFIQNGVKILTIARQRFFPLGWFMYTLTLYKYLKALNIDVFHIYLGWTHILELIASKIANTKCTITTRRGRVNELFGSRLILRQISNIFVDEIVANSKFILSWARRKERWKKELGVVIYNGVDESVIDLITVNPLHEFKEKTIVYVASLTDVKRHIDLLHAAKIVVDQRDDVSFLFVGDGYNRNNLEKYIEMNELNERIHLLGHRVDVRSILAHSTISLNCSVSECNSNAILESMAEGIPIIATNIEGNVELVSDGYNGILIQPQKPILLAEAILNMLIDPEKALNMGRNGKKQINRFFSKDAMVNKTTSLYAKYLY
jgi:glycosyltransferase involved in cell wall biosynthesis